MAKDEKGGKIRVVVFEMEGNNETLQEGLRALANTLGRSVSATPNNRIPATSNGQKALNKSEGKNSSAVEDVEFIEEEEEEPKPANTRKKNNKPFYRTPIVVELDLKVGSIPFEEFCHQKNPDTEIGKYLVIAVWLKENLNLDVIGIDHIYTCFRTMKWGVAKDVGQSLRKGKAQGYFKSPERGMYAITHIGIGVVDKMNSGL